MALSLSQTTALAKILEPGMKIASMGYPDVIAPIDALLPMGLEIAYREDSDAICRRHGLQQRLIPDAHSLFQALGCTLDVYDIVRERGCEILCDLNEKWGRNGQFDPQEMYDIVLDVGTVEHCFNIAQAIFNMAGMVKFGGVIIHENPFNWPNHGFYNLNPTWYADFYEANGFDLLDCSLVTRDGRGVDAPKAKRFRFNEGEVNVFALARRTSVQSFVFPVQRKYAGLIPAARVKGEKEAING